MKIIINGPQIAQKRPRTTMRSDGYHTINPNAKDKQTAKLIALSQVRDQGWKLTYDQPLRIDIVAHMAPSKALLKKYGQELHGQLALGTVKDNDNMQKFYMDVLNGIVYDDDRLVCISYFKKLYNLTKEYTEIDIKVLPWMKIKL